MRQQMRVFMARTSLAIPFRQGKAYDLEPDRAMVENWEQIR